VGLGLFPVRWMGLFAARDASVPKAAPSVCDPQTPAEQNSPENFSLGFYSSTAQ